MCVSESLASSVYLQGRWWSGKDSEVLTVILRPGRNGPLSTIPYLAKLLLKPHPAPHVLLSSVLCHTLKQNPNPVLSECPLLSLALPCQLQLWAILLHGAMINSHQQKTSGTHCLCPVTQSRTRASLSFCVFTSPS